MDEIVKERVWDIVEKNAKDVVSKYEDTFYFNDNAKYVFMQKMDEYEEMIKSKFMHFEVIKLDRHKIASIIICSVIEANVLRTITDCESEEVLFDGNEKIGVNIGLSYMRSTLLALLSKTSEAGKFQDYTFPEALTCDTAYKTIICRNLYYAKTHFMLNPIELSNTLFLLENYSLMESGVDLKVLKKKILEVSEDSVDKKKSKGKK